MRTDTWNDFTQLLTTAMERLAEHPAELAILEARIAHHEKEWATVGCAPARQRCCAPGGQGGLPIAGRFWADTSQDPCEKSPQLLRRGKEGRLARGDMLDTAIIPGGRCAGVCPELDEKCP